MEDDANDLARKGYWIVDPRAHQLPLLGIAYRR